MFLLLKKKRWLNFSKYLHVLNQRKNYFQNNFAR